MNWIRKLIGGALKNRGVTEFKKPTTSRPITTNPRPIPPPTPQPSTHSIYAKNPTIRRNRLTDKRLELMK